MSRDRATVFDMIASAEAVGRYVSGMSEDQFYADPKTQDAVMRRIEILGEATKRLSPHLRDSHPEIPWTDIAGMRNRLIHGYDAVQRETVWEAATRDVPVLLRQLTTIMSRLEEDASG